MEQNKGLRFPDGGIFYNSASNSAPPHIIGDLVILDPNRFIQWLQGEVQNNPQDQVRLSFQRPKDNPINGKPFVFVSDYRPNNATQQSAPQQGYQQPPQQYQNAPQQNYPQQGYQQQPPQQSNGQPVQQTPSNQGEPWQNW